MLGHKGKLHDSSRITGTEKVSYLYLIVSLGTTVDGRGNGLTYPDFLRPESYRSAAN